MDEGESIDFFGPSKISSPRKLNITHENAESLGLIVPTLELARKFSGEASSEIEKDEDVHVNVDETIVLKPKLTLDEALIISRRDLSNVQCKLQYVPYYVFPYECEVSSNDGKSLEHINGKLAINALTNDVYEWNENVDTTDKLEDPSLRLNPRIGEEGAKTRIIKAVMEINTKTIETVDDSDAVTIIEKKRVRPKSDAISLGEQATAYLPVWCAEGNNGQMIIDATSGEVMKSS